MKSCVLVVVAALAAVTGRCDVINNVEDKHHHHTHAKHINAYDASTVDADTDVAAQTVIKDAIAGEVKHLDLDFGAAKKTEKKDKPKETPKTRGQLNVNGPVPDDFNERFAASAAESAGCKPEDVTVIKTEPQDNGGSVVKVVFEAPRDVVQELEDQAAEPNSKLTRGPLHSFLVSGGQVAEDNGANNGGGEAATVDDGMAVAGPPADAGLPGNPVVEKGIDVDTMMPYGELEAFGREDTAQELTEGSIKESDEMVDQLERAEVAEEKRAVFRALTRLRGAAITSFDGVARSQTGNIDEYNKVHKWRKTHPVAHLADEESDVSKWAFPDSADLVQVTHNAAASLLKDAATHPTNATNF